MTVMQPEHWPTEWMQADLAEYRAGMLADDSAVRWMLDYMAQPGPRCLWSMGDSEAALWAYPRACTVPGLSRHWLDCLTNLSGLHPGDVQELWTEFDAACRSAPAWLVQYRWEISERVCQQLLRLCGAEFVPGAFRLGNVQAVKIDANAVYLMPPELWNGQRLAVVNERHHELAAAVGAHVAVWCPGLQKPKCPELPRIMDELFSRDWDLLLCAAGGLSTILCERAKLAGRKAFDIGQLANKLIEGAT